MEHAGGDLERSRLLDGCGILPPMAKDIIEVIARGVLIVDKHLLVCQNRSSGYRFLPGGHVEFGEPAGLALEREMQEEMGVSLKAGRFIGCSEGRFVQAGKKGDRVHHEINLLFELRNEAESLTPKEAPPCVEDHIQFVWTGLHRIDSDDRLLPASVGRTVAAWARGEQSAAAWSSDWV